jgi:3',5'-cyclic AMP phosphodiesterase CpdA
MKIAHISDIHWGKSWTFDRESLDKGLERVKKVEPDIMLITGDLTDTGLEFEYEGIKEYLDASGVPYLAVPGNHDAQYTGYRHFERLFCKDRQRFFTQEIGNYNIIGLDSSEPDIAEGHIGREGLRWLEGALTGSDKTPVIMLHHHLIPVPNVGRERNVLVDAGATLLMINKYRVPLVLTGHKHFPWLWKLNHTVVSNAGTISCERRSCPTSFTTIELDENGFTIEWFEVKGDRSQIINTFKYPDQRTIGFPLNNEEACIGDEGRMD